MTRPAPDVAKPTLPARGRALPGSKRVSFDAGGMFADGQYFDFDEIDGYHVVQSVRKRQDMDPLSWLMMLSVLFLFVDLAITNIDGVFYVAICLAVVGLLAYFRRAPDSFDIIRTSLVLTMDGRTTVVLETPVTDLKGFSVIQAELSRRILIHARQKDASLT